MTTSVTRGGIYRDFPPKKGVLLDKTPPRFCGKIHRDLCSIRPVVTNVVNYYLEQSDL